MANVSAASENAEQLRRRANRRLLGASVLLLIAIILVPIFLEREPPPLPESVDVKIPPVEGTKFDPKLPDRKAAPTEVPAITEPSGAQANVSTPNTTAAVVPSAPAKEAAAKEAPKAPTKAAPESPKSEPAKAEPTKAASATTDKPALKSGQLVVQLVAVRDPASAKEVYEKAKAQKVPVYTEQLTVTNGVVTRVRVGPYDTKQAADAARAKLAKAGFEAKVITLP
ncbi:MAG: SPOR domain-containing protein [Casimicrobium sp.]